jgi:hypothetical protein
LKEAELKEKRPRKRKIDILNENLAQKRTSDGKFHDERGDIGIMDVPLYKVSV